MVAFRTNKRTKKRYPIRNVVEEVGKRAVKVAKQVETDTDERVGRGKPILDKTQKKERSPKKTEGGGNLRTNQTREAQRRHKADEN